MAGEQRATGSGSAAPSGSSPRKRYDAPVLTRYGRLEEFTQGGGNMNGDASGKSMA